MDKEMTNERLKDPRYRRAYSDQLVDDTIALQIRTLRESRGLSQEQFGKLAKMSQTAISRIETSDYGRWTVSTLKRVAAALDVSLSVRFQSWGALLEQAARFTPEALAVPSFENDPTASGAARPYETPIENLLLDLKKSGGPYDFLLGYESSALADWMLAVSQESQSSFVYLTNQVPGVAVSPEMTSTAKRKHESRNKAA